MIPIRTVHQKVGLFGLPTPAIGGTFNPPAPGTPAPARTVRLRCLTTGDVIERQHVDAREILEAGGFERID